MSEPTRDGRRLIGGARIETSFQFGLRTSARALPLFASNAVDRGGLNCQCADVIDRKRAKYAQTTQEAVAGDSHRLPGAVRSRDGNEYCRGPLSDHLDQAD